MTLTKSDMARYPFVPDAAEYVRQLDLKIESLEEPENRPILERAEERVREALESVNSKIEFHQREDDIEISSFPVAIILASSSANEYIKRRYALAEAKRAYELLQKEGKEKILEIARIFHWQIRMNREEIGGRLFDFALHFADFLRNMRSFHEKEWKLVNRILLNGEVYLTKHEVARLLQEEIQRYIESKLDSNVRALLPGSILERVDRLTAKYAKTVVEDRFEFKEVVDDAFPPCIRELYEAAKSGGHISHVGRFTLTSFLLRIGMKPDDVVDLFRSSPDFNERLTRYQIEHIAGDRGSRTKYIPPRCETLRTHGVCPGIGDSCIGVRHPLGYYLRKTRMFKKEVPVS